MSVIWDLYQLNMLAEEAYEEECTAEDFGDVAGRSVDRKATAAYWKSLHSERERGFCGSFSPVA